MKTLFTKMLMVAGLAGTMAFAQDDDQDFYSYGQDENQEDVQEQDTEAPETSATADVKSNAPANVKTNVSVYVQNNANNSSRNTATSNSESTAENDVQNYERPVKKGRDSGVGVRVAVDYNSMYGFNEQDDFVDEDPSGFGFEAGLTARVEMVNNLYFVPELNFNYNSTSHEYLNSDRTYTSMNLEIPLMFRGVIANRFFMNAGPQMNLCLSSKVKSGSTYTDPISGQEVKSPYKEKVEQGSFSFGIVAGAGIKIIDQVSFDIRFYMGLSELFPDTKSLDDIGNLNDVENFSLVNMAGAKMMSIKAGFNFWFL